MSYLASIENTSMLALVLDALRAAYQEYKKKHPHGPKVGEWE